MGTAHLFLAVIAMAAVACGIGERCLKAQRRAKADRVERMRQK